MTLAIPQDETRLIAEIHRHGEVLQQQYKDSMVVLKARVDRPLAAKLEEYRKG